MNDYQTSHKKDNTWIWIAAAGGGLFLLLVCLGLVVLITALAIGGFMLAPQPFPFPTPIATTPMVYPPPTALPSFPTQVPDIDGEVTPEDVLSEELPPRDRYDLALRFYGLGEVDPPEPVNYELGDVIPFWVDNDDTEQTVEVMAELVYIAENVYMWVEEGVRYDYNALVRSADRFSSQTVPTNRSFFGMEASPGIDGDPRLHILHSTELGSWVAGYFFSPSEYPASVVPYSNEKEIFFINIGNTPPGDAYYDGVLAHEYQHMIHWNVDQNEETWMNEGMSELAAYLNGFGESGFIYSFINGPDMQLTDWPDGGGAGANYGAAFLFDLYFLERFGQEATRTLVANPLNGMTGVDDTLEQIGAGVSADQVFVDWAIANFLNDRSLGSGYYGYEDLSYLGTPPIAETVRSYPHSSSAEVFQYGTDYIALQDPGTVTITFQGQQVVQIIPTTTADTDRDPATEDRFVWWSNRGDDSDMMLTRAIDLTNVSSATLEYDIWYRIEDRWDYGYITVSVDDGRTWTILETPHTTTDDPHGNSYGPAYTGSSATSRDADANGWIHETIDLNAYAGQPILLRFEMITDDAVNQPGMAIDNLCIDALGWCDNVEAGAEEWDTRGFVRHNNLLEQKYSVVVLLPLSSGQVDVLPIELDDNNQGSITVTIGSDPAVLVVSGLTRYTTVSAPYQYTVTTP